MPRLARLFLCVLAVLAAAPAMGKPRRAASERAYQDALRRAQQHYAAREYDLAIAEWEAAHRIRPVPVLLFAIAQAQEVAGRPEQALAAYQDFVDEARPGAQRTQAETLFIIRWAVV